MRVRIGVTRSPPVPQLVDFRAFLTQSQSNGAALDKSALARIVKPIVNGHPSQKITGERDAMGTSRLRSRSWEPPAYGMIQYGALFGRTFAELLLWDRENDGGDRSNG